jgi:2-iminobutanoate/2-iminopropanoate deaminase
MKKAIVSDKAPKALGPYSAGVISGNNVFISGQLGMDPATGKLVEGIEGQARQSLTNLRNLLEAADMTTDNVVKTTVLLADLADFAKVNEIYGQFFSEPYPARACFQVAALPAGARVEIEAIAKG